jgi:hypothetical protein
LHQNAEAEFTVLMNQDTFDTLAKARISLHMRIDLFSVTGSPPGRIDVEEVELGYEAKTREELEQKWDGQAIQTSLSLKAITLKNFHIKTNNFDGDPDNKMKNHFGEIIVFN